MQVRGRRRYEYRGNSFDNFRLNFSGHTLILVGPGILAAKMSKCKCPFDCEADQLQRALALCLGDMERSVAHHRAGTWGCGTAAPRFL